LRSNRNVDGPDESGRTGILRMTDHTPSDPCNLRSIKLRP
jgi:hypothetical protein